MEIAVGGSDLLEAHEKVRDLRRLQMSVRKMGRRSAMNCSQKNRSSQQEESVLPEHRGVQYHSVLLYDF